MSLRRRGKRSSPESELDRLRSAREWASAVAYAKKLAKSGHSTELSATPIEVVELIVLAESSLEMRRDHNDARNNVTRALQKDPDNDEALGLLGLIELSANREAEALQAFNRVKIPSLGANKEGLYVRQLQILTESIYKKGFLLEKSNNHAAAITTYEELLDYAQHASEMPPSDLAVRSNLQKTAYRLAQLHENNNNNWAKSLRFFRISYKLSLPGSPNLSQLYSHFARFLVRRVSSQQWSLLPAEEQSGVYVPGDEVEEGLLLLLLYGETNEFKAGFSQGSADVSYFDDLAIAYGKRRAHKKQVESYERLLSLSFGDSEHWYSFGCSLFAAGQYKRAYSVFTYCTTITNDLSVLLFLGKIAVNHIHSQLRDVSVLCENRLAERNVNKDDDFMWPKVSHSLGLIYSKLASLALSNEDHSAYKEKSIRHLLEGHRGDSQDHMICFHLALEYADVRDIFRAMHYVRRSLLLNHSHGGSWNLLALLLTSQNQHQDALSACEAGLHESYDVELLLLKSQIEHLQGEDRTALTTAQETLLYLNQRDRDAGIRDQESDVQGDGATIVSERIEGESVTDVKVPTTTPHTSSAPNPLEMNVLEEDEGRDQASVWLGIAHIFLSLGQYKDAEDCLSQAKDYAPWSSDVPFYEGRIAEEQGNHDLALPKYQKSLAINPLHVPSLLRLGILYLRQDQLALSEKYLLSCLRKDERSHEAWYHLGRVEQHKGDPIKASEYFLAAIELERTAPVVPFSHIKRNL